MSTQGSTSSSSTTQDQFWRSAGHQMKTSLNLLSHRMNAFLEEGGDPQEKQEIQAELKHLSGLLKDSLTFSRSGHLPKTAFRAEKKDLGKTIQNITRKYIPQEKASQISFDLGKGILITEIDEKLFKEALRTILENAMTYSPKGNINISLRATQKKAILSIKNTGSGINQDDLPHIFEPFYRGASDQEGTGLGLSIASRIALQHQGQLTAQSDGATWTEFIFELPLISIVE